MTVSLPVIQPEFVATVRIEANVTYRCNAICQHCDKAVGYAKLPGMDMTQEQMGRAVDQLNEQKLWVRRLTICGGEPVLNKQLQGIIDETTRLPQFRLGRLLTNDLPGTKQLRDNLTVPKPYVWIPSPLDDPSNPLSGKNNSPDRKAYRKVNHRPFWISPADVGMNATFENCTSRTWCGRGLDASGWMMCGKAGILGRLFGIDPYMKDGDILKHTNTAIPDLCKHCMYGLPRKEQRELQSAAIKGEIPHSEVSPTYAKALEQYRANPVQFERF